jgi:hypothetical protein
MHRKDRTINSPAARSPDWPRACLEAWRKVSPKGWRRAVRAVLLGVLLCAGAAATAGKVARAEEGDVQKLDQFDSLGTGVLQVGAPPKTIVDDGERHLIIITIWYADAETRVSWNSFNKRGPSTTMVLGKGIQTFDVDGSLKLEAIGENHHRVEYGFVILGVRKD